MSNTIKEEGGEKKCEHGKKHICFHCGYAVPSQVENIAKVNESIDWEKEFKTPQVKNHYDNYGGVTTQPDEWEKEFDYLADNIKLATSSLEIAIKLGTIKSFIHSTIQSAVEREREEVVRIIDGIRTYHP